MFDDSLTATNFASDQTIISFQYSRSIRRTMLLHILQHAADFFGRKCAVDKAHLIQLSRELLDLFLCGSHRRYSGDYTAVSSRAAASL